MVGRSKQPRSADPMGRLLAETQALVSALLKENRSLKAENKRLAAEVDRLGKGWEELRRLARAAPRAKR